LKTSITTILWGKIRTLSKMRDVFREAKEFGYDGVGLETRLLPLQAIREPSLVKKVLGEAGIENAGSYSTMKPSDVGWAVDAGTPLLWVVARGEWKFDDASRAMGKLASVASRPGIGIAVHNHLGTCFETEAEMRKLLLSNKKLNVCFDTAHADAAGFDSARFIREFGDRISLVHLKDLRVKVPKAKVSFTKDFVNMGEGVVDFRTVFTELRDAGYSGSLMLETEVLGKKSPRELAREGFARIQEMLRAH
jgi:sugar phosphate isomerase/epimerase